MEHKSLESPLKILLNKPFALASPTYSFIGTPKVRLCLYSLVSGINC